MDISDLLIYAHKMKASDLHLSTSNPPILRLHGQIIQHEIGALTAEQVKEMIYSIMTDQQRVEYERELELDFAISFGNDVRFRVNAFNTIHGPAAVLRTIPTVIESIDSLNCPKVVKKMAELHNGLILVTGPTGSGKSTTLAAIVHHINTHYRKHILTIEDPVEFIHKTDKSLINQREVGRSSQSFSRALKSSLREDPDVILVGELRYLDTIQLALTAAETGHLVLATLHTKSAAESIDRIIDVFPPESKEMVRAMLANTLQGVVAQTLLSSTAGGRVAGFEVLLATPAVRNLIREGKIPQLQSMMQMGSRYGMLTMKDSMQKLFEDGSITEETLLEAMTNMLKGDSNSLLKNDDDDKPANVGNPAKVKNVPMPLRQAPQGDIF